MRPIAFFTAPGRQRRLSVSVVLLTIAGIAISLAVDAPGWIVAAIIAFGTFLLGAALWAADGHLTRETWRKVGESLMMAVVLAVLIGVPQAIIAKDKEDQDFRQALSAQSDLRGSDLSGKDLHDVRLLGKRLDEADLRNADLRGGNLRYAHLTGADLRGARLQDADLRDTELIDADLSGAHLDGAILARAKLHHARMTQVSLRKADVTIAELDSACLAGADLRGADFGGSDLTGAVFTDARLQGARFDSDLKPATLTHTGFSGAEVDGDVVWPFEYDHRDEALAGTPDPEIDDFPTTHVPQETVAAVVPTVADGDTLLLKSDRLARPVRGRITGIDAPSIATRDGRTARSALEELVVRRTVRISLPDPGTELDRGRQLVSVWVVDTESVAESLLDAGVVKLRAGDADPSGSLKAAELRAKQKGIGLWKDCPELNYNQSVSGR